MSKMLFAALAAAAIPINAAAQSYYSAVAVNGGEMVLTEFGSDYEWIDSWCYGYSGSEVIVPDGWLSSYSTIIVDGEVCETTDHEDDVTPVFFFEATSSDTWIVSYQNQGYLVEVGYGCSSWGISRGDLLLVADMGYRFDGDYSEEMIVFGEDDNCDIRNVHGPF